MATLKFVFSLDRADDGGVVRLWLDSNRDKTLDDEEELQMTPKEGKEFIAEKIVADDKANGMQFRVRYSLTPGIKWTMKVTADDKPCHESTNTVKHTPSGMAGHVEIAS